MFLLQSNVCFGLFFSCPAYCFRSLGSGGFERVFGGGGWGHKSVYVRAIFLNNVLVIHAYAFGSLARCLMSGIFAFRVVCVVS